MKFFCDAPGGKTWFRIETEAEAIQETTAMGHGIDRIFQRERTKATQTYEPASKVFIEQAIGLDAHLQRAMPVFLTLRDAEGTPLVTAVLPPGPREDRKFVPLVLGPQGGDPYPAEGNAIQALGQRFGVTLNRYRCYPHHRRVC